MCLPPLEKRIPRHDAGLVPYMHICVRLNTNPTLSHCVRTLHVYIPAYILCTHTRPLRLIVNVYVPCKAKRKATNKETIGVPEGSVQWYPKFERTRNHVLARRVGGGRGSTKAFPFSEHGGEQGAMAKCTQWCKENSMHDV